MLRNQTKFTLLCGIGILLLTRYGAANDECYDSSLTTIDRFIMRLENGTPYHAQEIECRKIASLRAKYTAQDGGYFAIQLSDHFFRDYSDNSRAPSTSLNIKQKPETPSVGISVIRGNELETQPIDTLRGYTSAKSER